MLKNDTCIHPGLEGFVVFVDNLWKRLISHSLKWAVVPEARTQACTKRGVDYLCRPGAFLLEEELSIAEGAQGSKSLASLEEGIIQPSF